MGDYVFMCFRCVLYLKSILIRDLEDYRMIWNDFCLLSILMLCDKCNYVVGVMVDYL